MSDEELQTIHKSINNCHKSISLLLFIDINLLHQNNNLIAQNDKNKYF